MFRFKILNLLTEFQKIIQRYLVIETDCNDRAVMLCYFALFVDPLEIH